MDAPGEVTQLAQRLTGAGTSIGEQLTGALGVAGELLLGHPETHPERHQPCLRTVVQVALDPAQLGLLNVHGTRPAPLQGRDPLGQRGRVRRAQAQHRRMGADGEDRDEQRPDRPEVARAGPAHRPDRCQEQEQTRPDAGMDREPDVQPVLAPTVRSRLGGEDHPSVQAERQPEREQRPDRPEVASRGQRPDHGQEQVEPPCDQGMDEHSPCTRGLFLGPLACA